MMDFVSDTHVVDRRPYCVWFRESGGGAACTPAAAHLSGWGVGGVFVPCGPSRVGLRRMPTSLKEHLNLECCTRMSESRSGRRHPLRIRRNERRLLGMFFCSSGGARGWRA
jgi:hypothetical protein